jgi:mono/diheme cytochrome c family protein
MRKSLPAVACLAALVALAGCGEEKHERGLEAIPDMFHTPAHKAQTALVSEDGKTEYSSMLPPVEGTVPRGFVPYSVAPTDWASAKLLRNPLSPSKAVLRQGQTWFNHTCAMCHGRDGNAAHGNVAKQFSGIPSVASANVLGMTDGELYHIMSVGRNRMPHLRAQLPPADRWAVASYVKVLARATVAAAEASDVIGDAEGAIRQHPEDQAAQAKMNEGKTILAQREADLKAILALGEGAEEAAAAFAPLPEPIPEYVPPSWHNPGEHAAGGAEH